MVVPNIPPKPFDVEAVSPAGNVNQHRWSRTLEPLAIRRTLILIGEVSAMVEGFPRHLRLPIWNITQRSTLAVQCGESGRPRPVIRHVLRIFAGLHLRQADPGDPRN